MVPMLPDCYRCKHKYVDGSGKAVCSAFSKGIPLDILQSKKKHDKPFPGDHGIQFERGGSL